MAAARQVGGQTRVTTYSPRGRLIIAQGASLAAGSILADITPESSFINRAARYPGPQPGRFAAWHSARVPIPSLVARRPPRLRPLLAARYRRPRTSRVKARPRGGLREIKD